MYSTYLHWKLLAPFACVGCVPLHVLVYVVLPTCFILINQVYTCGFAHHVCVFVCEPIASYFILFGSFERLMDYPILGE
jgi:hypothetical protein